MSGDWAGVDRTAWTPPPARTVVVVAHPDDESLGCGGLIAHQRAAGVSVVVVAVTDGEAAYPADVEPGALAARRRAEQESALAVLGVAAADVVRLGWPDGSVAAHEDELAAQLTALVRPGDLLVAPWSRDHHPDHEACGRAAIRAAAARRVTLVGTLVWAPVRVPASNAPGELWVLELPPEAVAARRQAVRAHRSQLEPAGASAPIVGGELLDRLESADEWFVPVAPDDLAPPVDRTSAAFFEALYRAEPDPWHFADDPTESTRYRAILDRLGPGPLGTVLEPACSIGVLTAAVAPRASRLVAFDASPTAVAAARARGAAFDHVEVTVGCLPADVPAGPFDVVVFSEVGYYFDGAGLDVVLDRVIGALAPGGRFLAGHWLGRSDDHRLAGAEVHGRIDARPELVAVRREAHATFLLDEWRRRDHV